MFYIPIDGAINLMKLPYKYQTDDVTSWFRTHCQSTNMDTAVTLMFSRHKRKKQRGVHQPAGSGCLLFGKGADSRQQQPVCPGNKTSCDLSLQK